MPNEGLLGIGAHTDYGALTFLYTDEVPGLQIAGIGHGAEGDPLALRAEGATLGDENWLSIPPMRGGFIVNIGDMLEIWTNGFLPSTLHRVVNKSGRERFSLALFYEPNGDCACEVLPTCVNEERPSRQPKVQKYGDWLQAKFEATDGG